MFETTLNVPTRHLRELTRRLSRAGFTVLDTGARVMTEEGPDSEATVKLLHIPIVETAASAASEDQDAPQRVEIVDPSEIELGVSA